MNVNDAKWHKQKEDLASCPHWNHMKSLQNQKVLQPQVGFCSVWSVTEEDNVGKPMSSVGMSAASAIDALVPTLCPHRTVAHVRCLEIELWPENAWWQYNSFSEALGKIVFELLVFGRVWFVAAICNFHMFPKFPSDMLPSGLWTLMWYIVLGCTTSPFLPINGSPLLHLWFFCRIFPNLVS